MFSTYSSWEVLKAEGTQPRCLTLSRWPFVMTSGYVAILGMMRVMQTSKVLWAGKIFPLSVRRAFLRTHSLRPMSDGAMRPDGMHEKAAAAPVRLELTTFRLIFRTGAFVVNAPAMVLTVGRCNQLSHGAYYDLHPIPFQFGATYRKQFF